jgi:hypothetical protein
MRCLLLDRTPQAASFKQMAISLTARPAWRIFAPNGDFFILTRFDPDKPEQCEHAFALISRFMVWRAPS